ncbi:MAG: uridine diphosphate-N-acetylglucosamine-binding protein YvcK [Trueperaceae bacterium]|nr:uridine diphosphate-N-acetylglucosamine-binding protein YvcK [Trueperaceae bacterium]
MTPPPSPPPAARPPADAWTRLRLWSVPGMGVKRFVSIAVAGALVLVAGLVAAALWLLADARSDVAAPIERVLASGAWRRHGGWASAGVALVGGVVTVRAILGLNRSLLSHWLPRPKDAAEVVHTRLRLSRGPRIVAFGGGTGLSTLLRGLRRGSSNLTAVVTVADDGGSSGRLRDAFGMPAPGDLSDCLAALSDDALEVGRLMDYRFERGDPLAGHTFGNLLITTLSEVEGDLLRATRVLNGMLNLSGAVWPATTTPVTLRARKADGWVEGESALRGVAGPVERLALHPTAPTTPQEVRDAVRDADLVVLGPGSLFTSVVAPLLVPGVRDALQTTSAPVAYVANIMTEAGETDGMDAFAHTEALARHVGRWPDVVLANDAPLDAARRTAYRGEAADPVDVDEARFAGAGVTLRRAALLGAGPYAQHDPDVTAEHLLALARRTPRREVGA